VLVVQTTAQTMPRRHPLRWAMDLIDRESSEVNPVNSVCSMCELCEEIMDPLRPQGRS